MTIESSLRYLTKKEGFVDRVESDVTHEKCSSYNISADEAACIIELITALRSKVGTVESGAVAFCYVGDVWSLRRKDDNATIANGIGELINKL